MKRGRKRELNWRRHRIEPCGSLESMNLRRLELQEVKRRKKSNFSDNGVGVHQGFPFLLSLPSFCCNLVLVLYVNYSYVYLNYFLGFWDVV